ncbi:hypothetical protein [Halopiger thermotolerans]
MTDDDRCGSTDTDSGQPCQRPAGWGTDRDSGPCVDHVDDDRALRKFDQGRREKLIGAAETGAFKEHCAQYAGITEQTLRNWLNWGEEDLEDGKETDLAEFYLDWQRARGRGVVERLENVDDDWVLERGFGYSKTEKREVDMDADVDADVDSTHDVTAEFVTYAPEDDDGDE